MSDIIFSKRYAFLLITAIFLIFPKPAYAYVDPGIIAVLFQYIYVVVFGFLAVLFLKPTQYIKSLFKKKEPGSDSEGEE